MVDRFCGILKNDSLRGLMDLRVIIRLRAGGALSGFLARGPGFALPFLVSLS